MVRDIHNFKRNVERLLTNIQNDDEISKENKDYIINFYEESRARGLAYPSIIKYIYPIRDLGKKLNDKSFKDVEKRDLIKVVLDVEEREDWTAWTKKNYKLALKVFFRWLRGIKKKGVYPEEVDWFSTTLGNINEKDPKKILKQEDIIKLTKATTCLRDASFLLSLWESGCRVGEWLPIKIGQLEDINDGDGFKVVIQGEKNSGKRPIFLYSSAPLIKGYLNQEHPYPDNPNAYLWINRGNGNGNDKPIDYPAMHKILRKAKNRAKIDKPVHFHAFRSSRAVFLATHSNLSDYQIKKMFGWKMSSQVLERYISLLGSESSKELARLSGLKIKEKEEKDKVKITVDVCGRCHTKVLQTMRYCPTCGNIVDPETRQKIDEIDRVLERKLLRILRKPEIKATLLS